MMSRIKFTGLFFLFSSVLLYAQATQPEWPKRHLVFEKSGEKLPWQVSYFRNISEKIRPSYVAIIYVEVETPFALHPFSSKIDRYDSNDVSGLAHNLSRYNLAIFDSLVPVSKKQKFFIYNTERGVVDSETVVKHYVKDKKNFLVFKLSFFAVSEKDACLMAEGTINYLDQNRQKSLMYRKASLEFNQKIRDKSRALIATLEERVKKKNAEIGKLQNTFHYPNPESAFTEFVEMDKLVRLINIDLAGLNARIKVTKKLSNDHDQNDLSTIYRLLKEQDIELAGLLARKKAAEENRNQVKKYYDLLKQVEEAKRNMQSELATVNKATEKINDYGSMLANHPEETRPVNVIDNKVIIHPVIQPETKPAGAR